MNLKYFLILIMFLIVQKTESQEKCICCAYHSFVYSENNDEFFNPTVISAEKIKTAIIFTIEYDSMKRNKYIQAKFHFDEKGKIVVKKIYYQGINSTITDFERNSNGQIIRKIETHMDSLENRSNSMGSKIWDYVYDANSNLIKVKLRDYNGKISPDNQSEYTKYEYDNLNRITREYSYLYYESNSIYIYDKTSNFQSSNESKSITLYNGKPWMQTISKYNNNLKLINQIESSLPELKMAWEEYYKYNENNQVISFIRKRGVGLTECPDGDNYTEDYQYNSSKLLEKITHKYGNVICEMIVIYEK